MNHFYQTLKKLALLLALSCVAFQSYAQTTIQKRVYSLDQNAPLENAHVLTADTVVFTSAEGRVTINFTDYLEVFHIGYESIRYENLESIPDTIRLIPRNNVLEEITISAERTIKEIQKEEKYWVKDFEIIYNHLVVLKKTHFRGRTKLALHDLDGNYVSDFEFDNEIEAIHLNCIGQLFVQSKYDYVLLYVSNDQLLAGPKYTKKKYEQVFEKCRLYRDQTWIYEYERYQGLERNIVGIKGYRETVIKNISLPQLLELKKNYQGQIAYGDAVSTITTNDDGLSRKIRRMQATSAFMDKVLLKAHETNSFAHMQEGILIANAVFDSLHYHANNRINKAIEIKKRDYVFNNTDNSKAYFIQINGLKDYTLHLVNENLELNKLLTIKEHVHKIKIHRNKVFYLVQDDRQNSVKTKIYFEYL